MKLNKQENEDCNAPVWQQLLPSSTAISSLVESGEVRVNIAPEEESIPKFPEGKRKSSIWLPFAPSWNERQRLRNGGEPFRQPSTISRSNSADDPIDPPKSPKEKSTPSPLMRLVAN